MIDSQTRLMKMSDINPCVDIHMQAFQGFFLTFLGPAFLKELYSSILVDPSGIGLVIERGGQVRGFVIGTQQPAGLYSRLLRQRWWAFGLASIGPLLRNPKILTRLLRAFRKPNEKSDVANCGTLMSIAVLPEEQGKSAGKQLVTAFLDRARQCGLSYVNLTTDALDNVSANRFYQKMGFVLTRTFLTPENRQMNEYMICLQQAAQPSKRAIEPPVSSISVSTIE